MENINAALYAVTAGIMLVIVLYISYIIIPILLLSGLMYIVFLFNKKPSTPSTASGHIVKIVW